MFSIRKFVLYRNKSRRNHYHSCHCRNQNSHSYNHQSNHRYIVPCSLKSNRFHTYYRTYFGISRNKSHRKLGHNRLRTPDHKNLHIVAYTLLYRKFDNHRRNHLYSSLYIRLYSFLYRCLRIDQYSYQDSNLVQNY
ncbi:MAG: hypothetical protein PUE11_02105 [Paraprevotella sp.]|nr:hypothetical protein [Paraprevotella sp.]